MKLEEEEKEEKGEISVYNGVELIKEDAAVLQELGKIIGEGIPSVKNVGMYRSGFVHKDRKVIGLVYARRN